MWYLNKFYKIPILLFMCDWMKQRESKPLKHYYADSTFSRVCFGSKNLKEEAKCPPIFKKKAVTVRTIAEFIKDPVLFYFFFNMLLF